MRNALVFLALLGLAASLAGCASTGPRSEVGAPDGGVTGATLRRAAVQSPDTLDFGGDVQTVEAYDLDASAAGVSNTIGGDDAARDQEIDAIVNTITKNDKPAATPVSSPMMPAAAPAMAPAAPPARRPAVPPLSKAGGSASTASGVTAAISHQKTRPGLPPLPAPAAAGPTAEQQDMAARQEALFPKPLWRRIQEQKGNPPQHSMPRGL